MVTSALTVGMGYGKVCFPGSVGKNYSILLNIHIYIYFWYMEIRYIHYIKKLIQFGI